LGFPEYSVHTTPGGRGGKGDLKMELKFSVTKREFFKNTLETEGIKKRRLCVSVWTETVLKTKLFESSDIMIVMTFYCPSFFELSDGKRGVIVALSSISRV